MGSTSSIYDLWALIFVLNFVDYVCGSLSYSRCLTPIHGMEFNNIGYFHYCTKGLYMRRKSSVTAPECGDNDKIQLLDFKSWIVEKGRDPACPPRRLRYKQKVNASCLDREQRDEIISPFLDTLSGKMVKTVKNIDAVFEPNLFDQISLAVKCETRHSLRMDICKPATAIFRDTVNVSLFFDAKSFRYYSNHSSCYCHIHTFNTTIQVSTRAYDIRLHQANSISFNSIVLPSDRIFWWQSGVLSRDVRHLQLSGLTFQNMPTSVWMDVYGKNLNITCDSKPPVNKWKGTGISQPQSSSSAPTLGTIYIVAIVLGAIILILIIAGVVKFCHSRTAADASKKEEDIDEPKSYKKFASIPYDGDDSDEDPTLYFQPDQQAGYSKLSKNRKRRTSEADHYELEGGTVDRNPVSSFSDKETCNALVHQDQNETADTSHIYNHFNDQPDVVPASPTGNIYDVTGTGIYSSMQTQRQISNPDYMYGVTSATYTPPEPSGGREEVA